MSTSRSVLRRLTSQGMLDMFEGVDPRFDWTLGCQKGGELFHVEDLLEGDALDLGSGGAILRGSSPLPGNILETKELCDYDNTPAGVFFRRVRFCARMQKAGAVRGTNSLPFCCPLKCTRMTIFGPEFSPEFHTLQSGGFAEPMRPV